MDAVVPYVVANICALVVVGYIASRGPQSAPPPTSTRHLETKEEDGPAPTSDVRRMIRQAIRTKPPKTQPPKTVPQTTKPLDAARAACMAAKAEVDRHTTASTLFTVLDAALTASDTCYATLVSDSTRLAQNRVATTLVTRDYDLLIEAVGRVIETLQNITKNQTTHLSLLKTWSSAAATFRRVSKAAPYIAEAVRSVDDSADAVAALGGLTLDPTQLLNHQGYLAEIRADAFVELSAQDKVTFNSPVEYTQNPVTDFGIVVGDEDISYRMLGLMTNAARQPADYLVMTDWGVACAGWPDQVIDPFERKLLDALVDIYDMYPVSVLPYAVAFHAALDVMLEKVVSMVVELNGGTCAVFQADQGAHYTAFETEMIRCVQLPLIGPADVTTMRNQISAHLNADLDNVAFAYVFMRGQTAAHRRAIPVALLPAMLNYVMASCLRLNRIAPETELKFIATTDRTLDLFNASPIDLHNNFHEMVARHVSENMWNTFTPLYAAPSGPGITRAAVDAFNVRWNAVKDDFVETVSLVTSVFRQALSPIGVHDDDGLMVDLTDALLGLIRDKAMRPSGVGFETMVRAVPVVRRSQAYRAVVYQILQGMISVLPAMP